MGLAELQVVHVTPCIYQHKSRRDSTAATTRADYEDRGVEEDDPEVHACSFLTVADASWSMFVVLPLVVGQWRGVWELMNVYIPNHTERSLWWSVFIGAGTNIIFTLLRKALGRPFSGTPMTTQRRFTYLATSRVYTTVFAIACVAQWRGIWGLIDMYAGTTYQLAIFSIGLGSASLYRLKSLRNLSGPPFMVVTDHRPTFFHIPTRYRTSGSKDPVLHVLDCLFSVLVVGSLVVIVWRGTWGILDHVLLPEDQDASAWLSLAVGYAVAAVAFCLQVPARALCDRLKGAPRLIVADIYQFFCFCGTVNLWRGVWNLLNIYLLPETPLASYWLTHWVCLVLLMLLFCSNSLLVRGVYIDGEEEGGQCVVFQCNYLRHRYQTKTKRHQTPAQQQQQQPQQPTGVQQQLMGQDKRKTLDTEVKIGTDNNVHVSLMGHMRDTIL